MLPLVLLAPSLSMELKETGKRYLCCCISYRQSLNYWINKRCLARRYGHCGSHPIRINKRPFAHPKCSFDNVRGHQPCYRCAPRIWPAFESTRQRHVSRMDSNRYTQLLLILRGHRMASRNMGQLCMINSRFNLRTPSNVLTTIRPKRFNFWKIK